MLCLVWQKFEIIFYTHNGMMIPKFTNIYVIVDKKKKYIYNSENENVFYFREANIHTCLE
jgi:hypothetical protein